ncbi:hypothetical protein KI387_007992, partial [Taxus chinensis]
VFQAQSVCKTWRNMVSSSRHFHELWEERNGEQWLVMEWKDCGAVALFNRGGFFVKKIFDSSLQRHLIAASGGLLLYLDNQDGMFYVVNPLTMRCRQLPDPIMGDQFLSTYLKSGRHTFDGVMISLSVDSMARRYQVIFKAQLTGLSDIMIYRSLDLSWQNIVVESKMKGLVCGKWFPYKNTANQTVYCFPMHQELQIKTYGSYNPPSSINLTLSGGKSSDNIAFAKDLYKENDYNGDCVMFIGTTIRQALWTPPCGRMVQIIYELDEASCEWNIISVCRWNEIFVMESVSIAFDELPCERELLGSRGGGNKDYVWIIPRDSDTGVHNNKIINFDFNGDNYENSTAFPMQLRFSPSP